MSRRPWLGSITSLFSSRTARRPKASASRITRQTFGHAAERMEPRCVLAAPDAPFGLIPASGDQQVSLTWTAPVSDGGVPITDYIVEYRDIGDPFAPWTPYDDGVSTEVSAVVAGLANGTAYVFQVAAVNDDAPTGGPFSSESPEATPAGLPLAPTELSGVVTGDAGGEVSLTWTAADGNGAEITSYVIEITDTVSSDVTTESVAADPSVPTQSYVVTGLVNGTAYVFRVAAVNGVSVGGQDQGEWSDATGEITPSALPAVPTIATPAPTGGIGEGGQLEVSWEDLQASDPTIAGYVLEYREESGDWQPVDAEIVSNSYVITGLIDGVPYTFRVAAKTIYDRQGEFSAESEPATPSPLPDVALDVTAVAGDNVVSLTWTEADGFGVAIAYYIIEYTTDGGETWTAYQDAEGIAIPVAGSTFDFVGGDDINLNGTTLQFRVSAVNAFGRQGDFSDASNEVTPVGAPDGPGNLLVQSSDRSVKLSWSDPENTGGLPITGYVVEYQRLDLSSGVEVPVGRLFTVTQQPVRDGSNLSLKISGLVNGAVYAFSIVTQAGDDVNAFESEPVITGAMPLAAVTRVVAKASPGTAGAPASVAVGWLPPRVPRGVTIVDYVIQYSSDAGQTWQTYDDGTSRATTARLTLENGSTYRFKVAAVTTIAGDRSGELLQQGDYSGVSAAVTPFVKGVVAGVPTGLTAQSLGGSVRLSWTAPAANDGGGAARYVVQYKLDLPNAKWIQATVPASSLTTALINRLGSGKSYSFRVAAVSEGGQSAWSDLISVLV